MGGREPALAAIGVRRVLDVRAPATPAGPSEGASEADAHFGNAAQVLVGGASGSARINAALGRPMLAASGDGAWFSAPDGRRYLDLWCAYGATVLGHNHPAVRRAIETALDTGVIHGPETPHQARLAARLVDLVPSAELVRFANSGTEATLAAIRLARTHTGRTKILKFEGHFHGIHDHVLFSAHPRPRAPAPGRLLEPEIDSGGVPRRSRVPRWWPPGTTSPRSSARLPSTATTWPP